jgi:hypothetical protein
MMHCALCELDENRGSSVAITVSRGYAVCEEHLHAQEEKPQPIGPGGLWGAYRGGTVHVPSFRAGQKAERESHVM